MQIIIPISSQRLWIITCTTVLSCYSYQVLKKVTWRTQTSLGHAEHYSHIVTKTLDHYLHYNVVMLYSYQGFKTSTQRMQTYVAHADHYSWIITCTTMRSCYSYQGFKTSTQRTQTSLANGEHYSHIAPKALDHYVHYNLWQQNRVQHM